MPLNADLFRKIADVIEREPNLYDQTQWGFGEFNYFSKMCPHIPPEQVHTCSTSHCIAGLAVALTPPADRPVSSVSKSAMKLLGLSSAQADYLFSTLWKPPSGMTVPQYLREVADRGEVF